MVTALYLLFFLELPFSLVLTSSLLHQFQLFIASYRKPSLRLLLPERHFLMWLKKNLCRIIFLDDLIQEERNYLNASLSVYCYWFHCHRLSSCSYTVSAISWIIPFYLKSSREQLWPMYINAVWMNLGTFSEQILVITGQWCANWPVSKISVQLGASVELTTRHP